MSKLQNSLGLGFFWVLFLSLNVVFNILFLYLYFPWLDVVMHVWGGMLVIWSWYHFHTKGTFSLMARKPIVHPMWFLVILIVTWEVYRYLVKNVVVQDYALDTAIDLAAGFTGGLVAYLWFSSLINKEIK